MPWFNCMATPLSKAHAKTGGCGLSPAPSSMAMNMSSCDSKWVPAPASLSRLLLGICSGTPWGPSQLCACRQACPCKGSTCLKWDSWLVPCCSLCSGGAYGTCQQHSGFMSGCAWQQAACSAGLSNQALLENHWNQEKLYWLGGAGKIMEVP